MKDYKDDNVVTYKEYPDPVVLGPRYLIYTGMTLFYIATVVGLGVILYFMDPLASLLYCVLGSIVEGLAISAYLRGEKSDG